MSSDETKKDLAARASTAMSGSQTAYPQSPLQNRGLMSRVWSRFMAGLNTKTIAANTEELRALDGYVNVRGELAKSMLKTDRAVFDYVEHRDDYLRDDHAEHLDRLEENEHQRHLNRIRREETVRGLNAHAEQAAVQRSFDHKVTVENNEAALAQAQWKAAHAQWGRDAFQQSLGYRRERLEHLYKTGAIDKEIDRLVAESLRDEALGAARQGVSTSHSATADLSAIAVLEQMLAELDQELEIAHATHAGDDHKAALYAMRSRLTARLDELRRTQAAGSGK